MPYKYFHIPNSCIVNNTIFKKLFYENGDLTAADKSLFMEKVKKISWLYCLKAETINVQPYKDELREYAEIEFLEIELSVDTKIKRIAEIIMRTIPYPMVLIFRLAEKVQLWTAHQRINQNDNTKNILEEFVFTDWLTLNNFLFDRLDIRKMRFTNYLAMYSDIVDVISIHNVYQRGAENGAINGEQARILLAKVDEIDQQIVIIRADIKKETQFNRKVEQNIQIKKLEQQKSKVLGGAT